MTVGAQQDVSVEALEALEAARERAGNDEDFLANLGFLERRVVNGCAHVIGNLCVMDAHLTEHAQRIMKVLTAHPDRFIAVYVDSTSLYISPESTIRNSALVHSDVHDQAKITNSVLDHAAVHGNAAIRNAELRGVVMQGGVVQDTLLRG